MARTALTVQQIGLAGITPSYESGDATNGHQFINDGRVYLHVKNTNASTRDVTILTAATVGGLDITDVVVTVPATTGDKLIGPFPTRIFNNLGGLVYVDLTASAGVTIAVFSLPNVVL